MQRIIIKSPAKINFGLNIISKRDDGFHNIETIFYPINLCDIITFEKSNSFAFNTNSVMLKKEIENNLIIKALRLIERHINKKINVSIQLEKNIPIGAGLGGGSSNAAHTLLSINELFDLKIPDEKIKEFSLILGSDVPFFLKSIPSFAKSRGEILNPIDFEINKPILIINPGIHISTKWAYENIKPKKPLYTLGSIKKIDPTNFNSYKEKIVNDFEDLVFANFPFLKEIKEKLYSHGAQFALMSGSGSTIFGIFGSLSEAKKTEKIFSGKDDHNDFFKKYPDKSYFTYIHRN
jgi:4-diphosphocytidyl-2-C-methyl-D-erythritol kinase